MITELSLLCPNNNPNPAWFYLTMSVVPGMTLEQELEYLWGQDKGKYFAPYFLGFVGDAILLGAIIHMFIQWYEFSAKSDTRTIRALVVSDKASIWLIELRLIYRFILWDILRCQYE
jgi:hypothetical protein